MARSTEEWLFHNLSLQRFDDIVSEGFLLKNKIEVKTINIVTCMLRHGFFDKRQTGGGFGWKSSTRHHWFSTHSELHLCYRNKTRYSLILCQESSNFLGSYHFHICAHLWHMEKEVNDEKIKKAKISIRIDASWNRICTITENCPSSSSLRPVICD